MKIALIVVIGILFLNSPQARNFTAKVLVSTADIVDTYWDKCNSK